MKKTLLLALFGVLVFPAVASAAWWNPLTWSWSDTETPQSIADTTENVDIPINPPTIVDVSSSTPSDNSALLQEIEDLKTKNKELSDSLSASQEDSQVSISSLLNQVNQCKNTTVSGVSNNNGIIEASAPVTPTGGDLPPNRMDTELTFPIDITRYDPEMNQNVNVTDNNVYLGGKVNMMYGQMPKGISCPEISYTTNFPDNITDITFQNKQKKWGISFNPQISGNYYFTFKALNCIQKDDSNRFITGRNINIIKTINLIIK